MAIDGAEARGLTGQQILDEDLPGWRLVLDRLVVRFRTTGFASGVAFVQQVGEVAEESGHHPDLDLRRQHVTVTLKSHDVDAITARDVRLARRISQVAADSGLTPTPHAPDFLELCLDTADHERVKPFYEALLGYEPVASMPVDLRDPANLGPNVWFQHTDSTAEDRQRWHLCLKVPHDAVRARIQAVLDAGGRLVDDSNAPDVWVLEDPDGNRSCLCTWQSPSEGEHQ